MNNRESNKAIAELNEAIIKFILEQFDSGRFETLDYIGINKSDVNSLRSLNVGEMRNIRNFPTLIADFKFNGDRAHHLVKHIESEADKNTKTDCLIELGASQPMLETLTGLDREEFKKRKGQMGIVDTNRGRPCALTDKEINRVNEILRHNKELGQIELYIQIGEESGINLSSVWAYIQSAELCINGHGN